MSRRCFIVSGFRERRDRMRRMVARRGFEPVVVRGYRPETLPRSGWRPHPRWADIETGRSLRAGQVACAFSHSKAWDAFLRDGCPECLIVEDDAVILDAGRTRLPVGADYCNVGPNPSLLGRLNRIPPSVETVPYFMGAGNLAYTVNRRAAWQLLAVFRAQIRAPGLFPLDEMLPAHSGRIRARRFIDAPALTGLRMRSLVRPAAIENGLHAQGTFHSPRL